MPKPVLRFVLLMLIMLNHAVSACESMVMHLPAENHLLSVLDSSDHTQHQHCSVENTDDAAAEHDAAEHSDNNHQTHAHVACYIAELFSVPASPAVNKASGLAQYALITTTYSPPVPPPNH